MVVLKTQEKPASIPGIVRSLMEAYVDLYNLSQDKNYGYGLEISYRREWLKIANEAENGNNRYLQGMAEEYKSIYNFLCAEAHNNMRALVRKHIDIEGTPPKLRIVALSVMGKDEESDILIAAEYLSKSNKLIHRVLKSGHEQKF